MQNYIDNEFNDYYLCSLVFCFTHQGSNFVNWQQTFLQSYVSVKSKLQHPPPGQHQGHLNFWKICVQIPLSLGQKAVQMPHHRSRFRSLNMAFFREFIQAPSLRTSLKCRKKPLLPFAFYPSCHKAVIFSFKILKLAVFDLMSAFSIIYQPTFTHWDTQHEIEVRVQIPHPLCVVIEIPHPLGRQRRQMPGSARG